jgi:hypothetical protein
MDYVALAAELALPAYAGLSDADAAAALNAATLPAKVDVPSTSVRSLLYGRGAWRAIISLSLEAKSGDAVHDAALVAAVQLVDFCRAGGVFSTSAPAILVQTEADLTALVAAGTIGAGDRAAILALADGVVSRAAALGLGMVDHIDVARARAP